MSPLTCKPCEKKTFPDEGAALTGALRASRRYGATYRIYPCPEGNGFHLTTKPEREPKKTVPAKPATTTAAPSAGAGFVAAAPLARARRLADADLKGAIPPADLAWLHANPLLWLRALIAIDKDIESHIAKDRASIAHMKMAQTGTPEHQVYLSAKAEVDARAMARLHFEAIVRRRAEEVKSLLGPQPAIGWVSAGDVLAILLDIAHNAEAGDLRAVKNQARYWAERWSRQVDNEQRGAA